MLRDLQEEQVLLDRLVLRLIQEPQAILDPRVHRVIRVRKVILEKWVRKETLVARDRRVCQDSRQIRELLVHPV